MKPELIMVIPDLGNGGAEHSFAKLSIELARNFNLSILTFSDSTSNYPIAGKRVVLDKSSIRSKVSKWINRIAELRKLKSQLTPVATISFLEGANYINILSGGKGKIIISVRGSHFFDEEISGLYGLVRKKILIPMIFGKANYVVAVSNDIRTEMITRFRLPENRIVTIPNFYWTQQIFKAANESLPEEHMKVFEKPVIIGAGRLHPQKNFKALIEVFARVKRKIACALVILGEGGEREALIQHAQELNLIVQKLNPGEMAVSSADIYFLGHVKNPYKYLHSAEIFALSSLWEGFPNVLVEAMICGTACLSADCPTGPREIFDVNTPQILMKPVETSFGTLLPLLDTKNDNAREVWEAELVRYLKDPELRKEKSKNAQIRAADFSVETVFSKWIDLLNK